ncbi:MerR family transcriptional regulator [Oricola thermophila]|uniref:MerR family transcriptional regulator n=1 Tax=Oricola thermophila TaxID=2742145 RepID=A0A6N1VHU7_9HYPH|nr:MerR family transcriptional regulator [Oricola thermophila]QKV18567.1 MerR family transcriptional regulator [Oricola thermophila]
MQIGTLSKRTGVSVRMLRYYEQEGLLAPRRRPSGYRDYDKEDEDVVRRIRLLSEAGLKLDFIRRFLPCVRGDAPEFEPCSDLLAAMRREIDALDERIESLRESRRVLDGYLASMTVNGDGG